MTTSLVEKTITFLIDHRAFALGYPIGVSHIAQACDYVLTSIIGANMTIIGIIDCDKDPLKRAIFTSNELNHFGVECRQFTYHAYSRRLGVNIEFWYIGKDAVAILQEPRIYAIKEKAYKFSVSSWALSPYKVVSNVFSVKNWLKSRFLLKMIQKKLYLTPIVLSLLS